MPAIAIEEQAQVELIHPDRLTPNQNNPRGVFTKENVAELVASIERHGQTQPCVVRRTPTDFYEIVLGHRRWHACTLLGRQVRCFVVDLTDDQALAIMLSDNEVRTDPDPFLEADAVDAFLARPNWTVTSVADALGKSVKWVAARANLRTLIKPIRVIRNDPKSKVHDWPITWLEEIAKLSPDAQALLVKDLKDEWREWDRENFDETLAEHLQVLGKATWDLADATLVPKAGACTTCPKTSIRSPGLFDEDLEEKDVSKAKCRDRACWDKKAEAQTLVKINKLKAANPAALVVKGRYDVEAPKGVKALDHNVLYSQKSTKSDPKAVPAVVFGGDDDGKTVYIVPPDQGRPTASSKRDGAGSSAKEDTRSLAEKLKDSKEKISRRRMAQVVDAIRDRIDLEKDDPLLVPPVDVVMRLAAAYQVYQFGASGKWSQGDYGYGAEPSARKKIFRAAEGPAWAKEVWPRVAPAIRETLKRHNASELDDQHDAACWLAEVLVYDIVEIDRYVREQIPDPKWWGTAEEATTPAPAPTPAKTFRKLEVEKPAKKTKPAPAKKAPAPAKKAKKR